MGIVTTVQPSSAGSGGAGAALVYPPPCWLRTSIWQVVVAEFLGTVALVYLVTLLLNLTDPRVPPLGIAAGVLGLIAVFGNVSGAHFNPAVTVSFFLCEFRFPLPRAIVYLFAECFGAIAGMYLALASMSGAVSMDAVANPYQIQMYYDKGFSLIQIGLTELIWTALLTGVCLRGGMVAQDPSPLTPFFVAAVIISGSWAGGPISGCCMNPAIGLAYAIRTGSPIDALMYSIGPIAGSVLGAFISILFDRNLWLKRLNAAGGSRNATTSGGGSRGRRAGGGHSPVDDLVPEREPPLPQSTLPETSAAKFRGPGAGGSMGGGNIVIDASNDWEP